jgi:hypothetical protein
VTVRPLARLRDRLAALADPRARWTLALLGICALGLVPRLWAGVNDAIEYDGWWHIFAAQQDLWRNFVAECRAVAHPPLYLLLLRYSILFGKTRLVYRAVSIAAGVASVFMVGRVARRLTGRPAPALVAALACAVSPAAVEISCEVRSYSLAILFVLVACDALLRVLADDCERPARELARFSAASCLALFSHYYVAFFLGACAVIAAVRPLADPLLAARLRRLSPRQWIAGSALLAPVALSAAYLYVSHAHAWVTALNHLPAYYLQAGGGETARAFLLRNVHAEFNLFSPIPLPGGPAGRLLAAGVLLVVFVALPYALALEGGTLAAGQATALAFVPVQASALAAAAVLDAYPFGGWLRHQSILLPFLLLALAVVLDRVAAVVPWRPLALGLLAVAGVAVAADGVHGWGALTIRRHEIGWPLASRLSREFPRPEAVYADQYSFIALFANLDRPSWRYVDGLAEGMPFQRYELRCGPEPFFVLRDTGTWNVDFASAQFYGALHDGLARLRLGSAVVFFLDQFPPARPRSPVEEQAFRAQVEGLAARTGLRADRIVLDGYNALVELELPVSGRPALVTR